MQGRALCWLEWGGAWEPQSLGPHLSCLGPLRNSELFGVPPENHCPSWPLRSFATWKMMLFYEDAQNVTPFDLPSSPNLFLTFIEMEQPGRIVTCRRAFLWSHFLITHNNHRKEKPALRTLFYCVYGTVSSLPRDKSLHCSPQTSWGENPLW